MGLRSQPTDRLQRRRKQGAREIRGCRFPPASGCRPSYDEHFAVLVVENPDFCAPSSKVVADFAVYVDGDLRRRQNLYRYIRANGAGIFFRSICCSRALRKIARSGRRTVSSATRQSTSPNAAPTGSYIPLWGAKMHVWLMLNEHPIHETLASGRSRSRAAASAWSNERSFSPDRRPTNRVNTPFGKLTSSSQYTLLSCLRPSTVPAGTCVLSPSCRE